MSVHRRSVQGHRVPLALLLALLAVAGAGAAAGPFDSPLKVKVPDPVRVHGERANVVDVNVTNVASTRLTVEVRFQVPTNVHGWRLVVDPPVHKLTLDPGESAVAAFTVHARDGSAPATGKAHAVARWTYAGKPYEESRFVELEIEPSRSALETAAASAALAQAATVAGYGVAGALGGAAIGGVVTRVRHDGWWRVAPFYALYSRIRRSDVLRHDARRRVLEAVKSDPGIRFNELKRRTGLPNGVLYHHLRILEEHRFIASRRTGTQRAFTPAGVPVPERVELTPTERDVLERIPPGGITQQALADVLGVTRQGANYHVKNLEAKGAVRQRVVDGEWRCYRADDDA